LSEGDIEEQLLVFDTEIDPNASAYEDVCANKSTEVP
jgi:hypothetical protein